MRTGLSGQLVNTLAQTFSGAKTFLSAVVLSAGLQINGVLAASSNYLAKFEAVSTSLPTNGTTKVHIGHGNRPSQLVSTLALFNSLGRGAALLCSANIARLVFDNTAPFYISTGDRTLMETGDYLGSSAVRLIIDPTSNFVAVATGNSLQTIDANTWNKAQRGAVGVLTSSGGSVAINLSNNNNFSHTLTENTTLAAPSNPVPGQYVAIALTNGAGPFTLSFNPFWKFPGGVVPTLTATPGATDMLFAYVYSSGAAACQLQKAYA